MSNRGQSLIELLVAVAIFGIASASLAFFILDSYSAGRLAKETTLADFLAQEGLEAVRSIRDNNFGDLTPGNHGLQILANRWVFQGTAEDIGADLTSGVRQITIENISADTKRITSSVNWQFGPNRPGQVQLATYLTNWRQAQAVEIRKPTRRTDSAGRTSNDPAAYDYPDGTTFAATRYGFTSNPSITFWSWQLPTQTYSALTLKYRYHAEAASNDQYAAAYSVNGCSGAFTDLIPLTSLAASDTTISVSLLPSQNLAQLCLKIYSWRVASNDGKSLFTRDIWTEGTY